MPKKTTAAIVTSGNDYVLQVKGNQPKLRAAVQAQHNANPAPALDYTQVQERLSGAVCTWQASSYVCADPVLQTAWAGCIACAPGGIPTPLYSIIYFLSNSNGLFPFVAQNLYRLRFRAGLRHQQPHGLGHRLGL